MRWDELDSLRGLWGPGRDVSSFTGADTELQGVAHVDGPRPVEPHKIPWTEKTRCKRRTGRHKGRRYKLQDGFATLLLVTWVAVFSLLQLEELQAFTCLVTLMTFPQACRGARPSEVTACFHLCWVPSCRFR